MLCNTCLLYYGIHGIAHQWFASNLRDRKGATENAGLENEPNTLA